MVEPPLKSPSEGLGCDSVGESHLESLQCGSEVEPLPCMPLEGHRCLSQKSVLLVSLPWLHWLHWLPLTLSTLPTPFFIRVLAPAANFPGILFLTLHWVDLGPLSDLSLRATILWSSCLIASSGPCCHPSTASENPGNHQVVPQGLPDCDTCSLLSAWA